MDWGTVDHRVQDHPAPDQDGEHEVAPGEPHPGQWVCGHRAHPHDDSHRAPHGDDDAVEAGPADACRPGAAEQHLVVVRARDRPREPLRRHPDDGLGEPQRPHQHPHCREQPDERQCGERGRQRDAPKVDAPAPGRRRPIGVRSRPASGRPVDTPSGHVVGGTEGRRRPGSRRRAPTPSPKPPRRPRSSGTPSRTDAGRPSGRIPRSTLGQNEHLPEDLERADDVGDEDVEPG